MATKKVFTNESLETFVDEVKSYANTAASAKADLDHSHAIADVTNLQTTLDGKSNTNHTHNANTINSVYEANLQWGGKNIEWGVTPIDAAASNLHSANRFAFAKPAGIIIEYSNDAGATWIDYEALDTEKIKLVSGIDAYLYLGKREAGGTTVDDKLRITLRGTAMGTYALLRKLLISVSSNGASGFYTTIEKSNQGSEDVFTNLGTYDVDGWSAWNSIPASYGAFGGGVTQYSNTAVLRLTFGITAISESSDNRAHVRNIIAIGDNSWAYPSEMARTGHIYRYDYQQNATFPANVKAASFTGSLSGNATSATKATQDGSGNIITSTYETKADASAKLTEIQSYVDNAVNQKSQVQIITWEADD